MEFAKGAGCYKVILDCGESNVAFYEKCGLTRKEVQMVSVLLAPAKIVPLHREVPRIIAAPYSRLNPCLICGCLCKQTAWVDACPHVHGPAAVTVLLAYAGKVLLRRLQREEMTSTKGIKPPHLQVEGTSRIAAGA